MAARGRGLFSLYICIKNLKNLLVRNHWTDFNIILQKSSFGDPLPRLFKPFGFVKNMAARWRGLFSVYIYIENFKNLLVRNHWTDFNIILQKCSFGDSLPRLFKPFGFVKKHGRQGAGLIFLIYLYRKLKKSSCQKPLDQLLDNFAEIFLWWFCTKIVQAIWICQKTLYPYLKFSKDSVQLRITPKKILCGVLGHLLRSNFLLKNGKQSGEYDYHHIWNELRTFVTSGVLGWNFRMLTHIYHSYLA